MLGDPSAGKSPRGMVNNKHHIADAVQTQGVFVHQLARFPASAEQTTTLISRAIS